MLLRIAGRYWLRRSPQPIEAPRRAKYRTESEAARITQLRADSATADWAAFGGPFDIIFVDGCHDYAYVKSDSLNAISQTRPVAQSSGTTMDPAPKCRRQSTSLLPPIALSFSWEPA
jgi:hypothetical protein